MYVLAGAGALLALVVACHYLTPPQVSGWVSIFRELRAVVDDQVRVYIQAADPTASTRTPLAFGRGALLPVVAPMALQRIRA